VPDREAAKLIEDAMELTSGLALSHAVMVTEEMSLAGAREHSLLGAATVLILPPHSPRMGSSLR
jgi:hypothetical protein